jgi:hypothetical protein
LRLFCEERRRLNQWPAEDAPAGLYYGLFAFSQLRKFQFIAASDGEDTTGSAVSLRRAESFILGFAAALTGSVTGSAAPSMEPQTAHPVTQSSQWLSWTAA